MQGGPNAPSQLVAGPGSSGELGSSVRSGLSAESAESDIPDDDDVNNWTKKFMI